ncbi:hypothetical protein MMC18_006550 [Xylographa bjoerkii]|nr:hypothetical protein [Xylographa bjoerkii]
MATVFDNEEKGLPHTMRSLTPSWLGLLKGMFSRSQRVKPVQYTPEPHPSVLQPSGSQPSAATTGAKTVSYLPLDPLDGPLAADNKLATFRRMTGISSAPEHITSHRPAKNRGIYARVVENENDALSRFKFSSRLINGCLALQLIVAASLTALGAGNGPHAAVTVFGAVNTIIAGFLTYLKGSGLPNRHKFYASSWSKVREYMEQREREFEHEDCLLDVGKEVQTVEHMYEEVRQDVEANEPDKYTSTGQLKRNDGLSPSPELSNRAAQLSHWPGHNDNKMPAMTEERISTFGKGKRSQTLGEDQNFGFNGSKMATQGGDRVSGLDEKLHFFGAETPPSVPDHRKAEDEAALYFSNTEPIHEADQRIQAAMAAGVETMGKAKQMEAGIKEELEALAAGIERTGAARLSQATAAMASGIEKERLGTANAVGESAERLKEAGEQRLGAARTIKARVEDALRSGIQNVEKIAEDSI